MDCTVSTAKFQVELALVAKSAAVRATTPILSGVLLEAREAESGVPEEGTLVMTATDLDSTARSEMPATVRAPGRVVVSAATLVDFAAGLSAAQIDFLPVSPTEVRAKCGRTAADLPTMEVEDFPVFAESLPTRLLFTCPGGHLLTISARCGWAVSDDEKKPGMHGVCLLPGGEETGLRVLATAGVIGADLTLPDVEHHMDDPAEAEGVLHLQAAHLARAAETFEGEQAVEVFRDVDGGVVAFQAGGRLLAAKLYAEPFVAAQLQTIFQYQKSLWTGWAEVDRTPLLAAVRRVGVVSKGEPIRPVLLAWNRGPVTVYSASKRGRAEDEVPADADGAYRTVHSVGFLEMVLRAQPGETLRLDHQDNPDAVLFVSPAQQPEGAPLYTTFVAPRRSNAEADTFAGPKR